MAWTTPRTWVLDEVVSETLMNTHLRDQLRTLYPDYGTTLPGSPYNDKHAILVDSTSAPTYRWHLRYNSSIASAYKWEFIGGTRLLGASATITFANQTSYVMTNSPAGATAPVAGIYDVIVSATNVIAAGNHTYTSYNINGAGADDAKASQIDLNGGSMWMVRRETLAASDLVRVAYRTSGTGTNHTIAEAQVSLLPVQIG